MRQNHRNETMEIITNRPILIEGEIINRQSRVREIYVMYK
jgi:hypothetical protein